MQCKIHGQARMVKSWQGIDPSIMVKILPDICDDKIEPTKEVLQIKSIWKDVSELPKDLIEDCFIKYRRGGFSIATAYNGQFIVVNQSYGRESIKKYCTLTDYINNTEERLKKLEEK